MTTILTLLTLLACNDSKPTTVPSTNTGDTGDTGGVVPPDPVQPTVTVVGSIGVGALDSNLAGYSFAAVSAGFAWVDAVAGVIYVCAPTSVGDVADVCTPRWTGREWSIDKISSDGSLLAVADGRGAGIAYTIESDTSGSLSDVYSTRVMGAYSDGYAGTSQHIDADLDGATDDLVVATGLDGSVNWDDSPEAYGEIAVFLNAPDGSSWTWTDADMHLLACMDGGTVAWGPTQLISDGTRLYASCPGYGYFDGAVESWALPLTDRSADWQVWGPSGWYMAARPEGGVYADGRGYGGFYTITPDGDSAFRSLNLGGSLDGTAPSVLTASNGRTYIVMGSQSLSAASGDIDEGFYGSVLVCDISTGDWDARRCTIAELPSDGYATCTGAVQALVEIDGEVYVGSSGWVYGSGAGCGVTIWRVGLTE